MPGKKYLVEEQHYTCVPPFVCPPNVHLALQLQLSICACYRQIDFSQVRCTLAKCNFYNHREEDGSCCTSTSSHDCGTCAAMMGPNPNIDGKTTYTKIELVHVEPENDVLYRGKNIVF